jgi:hypothetical protein
MPGSSPGMTTEHVEADPTQRFSDFIFANGHLVN